MDDEPLVFPLRVRMQSLLRRAEDLMTVAEHWNEAADRERSLQAVREARRLLGQAYNLAINEMPRR